MLRGLCVKMSSWEKIHINMQMLHTRKGTHTCLNPSLLCITNPARVKCCILHSQSIVPQLIVFKSDFLHKFINCVLRANNWLIGGKTSWEKPRHNLGIEEGRYFCKDETLHLSCCCGSGWGRGWGLGVRLWGNEQESRKDPSVPIVANEERAGRSRRQSSRKVSVKSTFLIFNLLWFSFQTKFGVSVT